MAEQENHHGWAPDVAGDDPTAAEAGDKARAASGGDPGGSGDHSTGGTLSPTGMEPDSGDSHRKGGEEIAAGKGGEAEGHKGVSQRPYGTTD
ncbi:hypothetical protein QRX60_22350 [Amycolatopsis mongoliensis]|uniref:Uncharacterized protein n=1 Tax=Amycolatopsis mongoliensis TaxID=715475 RepID=A0A9Y2NQA1_9PSEU|nr:hypothetical protein [Amycolatopsis sp. 4-36]WIY06450.1 hypothetical protein QRX60_22350 [Amycolatopsis sp. 4-36]